MLSAGGGLRLLRALVRSGLSNLSQLSFEARLVVGVAGLTALTGARLALLEFCLDDCLRRLPIVESGSPLCLRSLHLRLAELLLRLPVIDSATLLLARLGLRNLDLRSLDFRLPVVDSLGLDLDLARLDFSSLDLRLPVVDSATLQRHFGLRSHLLPALAHLALSALVEGVLLVPSIGFTPRGTGHFFSRGLTALRSVSSLSFCLDNYRGSLSNLLRQAFGNERLIKQLLALLLSVVRHALEVESLSLVHNHVLNIVGDVSGDVLLGSVLLDQGGHLMNNFAILGRSLARLDRYSRSTLVS